MGRNGSLAGPAALRHDGAAGALRRRLRPCAALQVSLRAGARERVRIVFLLGQGDERRSRPRGYRPSRHRGRRPRPPARQALEASWNQTLGDVQVRTPDDSFDVMINRWLVYQDVSCRLWTRAAYYQPGGAFGFRDQFQDVMALPLTRPELAREHLLRAAGRQFVEGDVPHWWHEPADSGLRIAMLGRSAVAPLRRGPYVRTTGDTGVLDERVGFLTRRCWWRTSTRPT